VEYRGKFSVENWNHLFRHSEKFVDTTRVIRIRKSKKNIQMVKIQWSKYNGQNTMVNRMDKQWSTNTLSRILKIEQHKPH
jgi:hypothetical protein